MQALGDVVDVVGDSAEEIASRLRIDIREWESIEFVLNVGTQREHGALHDAGQYAGLGE